MVWTFYGRRLRIIELIGQFVKTVTSTNLPGQHRTVNQYLSQLVSSSKVLCLDGAYILVMPLHELVCFLHGCLNEFINCLSTLLELFALSYWSLSIDHEPIEVDCMMAIMHVFACTPPAPADRCVVTAALLHTCHYGLFLSSTLIWGFSLYHVKTINGYKHEG